MRHRKTTNIFGISRGSVLVVIKRVSFAITTFSRPEPIKFPSTKKQKELTDELLETHKFPQCIWTRDDTHIDNTKWTLLGLYRQKKLFSPERLSCVRFKVLISKCSDKRTRKRACLQYFFLNSSINKMFWKRAILPREKTSYSSFPIRWFCISLLPFITTEFPVSGNI